MKEFELEPGEHVVQQTHKHWLLFLTDLLPYAILTLLPFAVRNAATLVPAFAPFAETFDFRDPLARAALGAWLLVIWTAAWCSFTRHFLNIWVLTNKRIVDIEQRTFFNREVAGLLLTRIQDVTTEVKGFLPSLLNIGNIKVQSAGAQVEVTMRGIPRPEQIRDLILRYVAESVKKDGA